MMTVRRPEFSLWICEKTLSGPESRTIRLRVVCLDCVAYERRNAARIRLYIRRRHNFALLHFYLPRESTSGERFVNMLTLWYTLYVFL